MTIRKKSAVKAYGGAVSRILFLVLTAALLGGCTPRNVTKGMAEGEAYDAVISVKGKQEEGAPEAEALDSDKVASEAETLDPDKADSDSGELLALAGLLGKTDDEAAEAFGGGEENRTEDGKALVGRSYETTLFGKACSVHTSYDDNGLVWLVLAEPRELAAQELRKKLWKKCRKKHWKRHWERQEKAGQTPGKHRTGTGAESGSPFMKQTGA